MADSKSLKAVFSSLVAPIALAAMLGITGLAVVSSRYGWTIYLELFSHFQVQYFVIALLLLGLLGLLRRRWFGLIGLFCCTVLALQIVPWYLPPQWLLSQPPADLRVFIANLNVRNRNYAQVLSLVRQERPDLAVFMEVNEAWVEQLNTLRDLLPYSSGQSDPYHRGLVVYSNQPLNNSRIEFFGTDKSTSVMAEMTIAGQPLSLLATHPLPPIRTHFFHSRNQQFDLISQALSTVNQPILLMGDLNVTLWSPYYRRLVNRTGLKDARQGFGILPTWTPTGPSPRRLLAVIAPLFAIPIDHCLVSPSIEVTQIRVGADTGSDHRPVIVDLKLPASKALVNPQ